MTLAASDQTGPLTGLAPTARVRDGATEDSYLDFDDLTFKTSGWVSQDATLVEIDAGHYLATLDVPSIVDIADVDSLVIEYHAEPTGGVIDASEVVALQQLTTVGLTLTINNANEGGVEGLTATVAVRDEGGQYLDFDDATFKGSGWGTRYAAMTDIGRGHYTLALDVASLIGATGTELVAEYATTGDVEVTASERLEPMYSVDLNDVPPTVENFSPALSSDVQPGGTVQFDLLDDESSFSVAGLLALFEEAMLYEVVHDGDRWGPMYSYSTRTAISGGWRYVLRRRSPGWPREALKIRLLAADSAGNVVVL